MTQPNIKTGTLVEQQRASIAVGANADIDAAPGTPPVIGSLLVLCVGTYTRDGNAVTVTDNQATGGNTWTQRSHGLVTIDASHEVSDIWTCVVSKTVSSPFTIHVAANNTTNTSFHGLLLFEVENFDAVTPIRATGPGSNGNGTTGTDNLPDTSVDCFKVGSTVWNEITAASNGGGGTWTLQSTFNDNATAPAQGCSVVTKGVTGADTTDPTFTYSGTSNWAVTSIAIAGAASGGGSSIAALLNYLTRLRRA